VRRLRERVLAALAAVATVAGAYGLYLRDTYHSQLVTYTTTTVYRIYAPSWDIGPGLLFLVLVMGGALTLMFLILPRRFM